MNIVFDTTGQNFGAVSDLIRFSKEKGYKTYFVIVWASRETCFQRVEARNQKIKDSSSGRLELPMDVAKAIYDGFMRPKGTASMFLLDYPVEPTETLLYNNNNNDINFKKPSLIYHKYRENDKEVIFSTDFPDFYNMNISASPPYITKKTNGGKRKKTRKNTRKKARKNTRKRFKSR